MFSLISLLRSIQLPKTFEIKSWDDKIIIDHLKEKYESRILDNGIIVVMVTGNIMYTGTTLEGGDYKSYTIVFDVLAFTPKILETVLGEVKDVTGAIKIGMTCKEPNFGLERK